ncbi:MAG: bifunctional diaminohydroxyphosphoribosylaminopyrimidine deaminase/5-amino-6-(5-phosphoribosylamino)uracil reductase RibD, partial [Gammaproteobacteria bacterium]|nr:bifunctional diaminohydroxyphosphoribosylaminopyrimidine deaminase/5-amino-6-(5-phosphoribosylamino)uracil reductase RibD [Gammaproteobacteria bacterium]
MSNHAYFMERALSLAAHGSFTAHPNPMVGSVIVNQGTIVGEGWHRTPGTPHAEIHALNQAGALAKGADVYVNLEPCSHTGRTLPCVDALIKAQVGRVIIPFTDPNPRVNGQGIERLKAAGIEVIIGVERDKAAELNRFFLKAMATSHAYVIAKWAMTLDGQLTQSRPHERWITGETARYHAHQQRAKVGAILIGANTLRLDKPQLTARLAKAQIIKQPRRIILSRTGDILPDLHHITGDIWVVTAQTTKSFHAQANVHHVPLPLASDDAQIDLLQLLSWLVAEECYSLLVEGGNQTHAAFFNAELVDELHIYQALIHSGHKEQVAVPFFKDQRNWRVNET